MKRGLMRAPRRGWSMTEYQGEVSAPQVPHTMAKQSAREASIPEHSALPSSETPIPPTAATPGAVESLETQLTQLPRRPKMPPPRRSYSVMDYEPPAPNQPKPSTRMTLLDLPSEVHYLFCDYLDPIDSVCFGLAHSKLYAIHRRKYGTVSLASRYSGPNDMEWAWRGAGPLVRSSSSMAQQDASELAKLRTKGQVYCRKCGISRCELHRHLKEWMGPGKEYCEIRATFGKPPGEDAKTYCHMSSPKNPHRCGRHGGSTKPV